MTATETIDLSQWIGRTESVRETLAPFPSRALAALLDRDPDSAGDGEIPPLAHWLYFLPLHRQSELAPDGHVQRGGFMPPVPLPRRMFAGARITFLQPLNIGTEARRVGRVTSIKSKTGRTGALTFVQVHQEIEVPSGLALMEEQDIVYRTHPSSGSLNVRSGGEPLENPQWRETYRPDASALLRYSALLFNAHRIHYDHRYTTEIEHYPDLIVHGQLVATLLADLAHQKGGPLASFAFRSHAPLFVDRQITLTGRREGALIRLAAEDESGLVAMTAEAELRQVMPQ